MINVAIDGPAGAGKSTISKGAAKKLGYIYVDTGALYRTVALCAARNSAVGDAAKIEKMLSKADIELKFDSAGTQRVYLNGEDVSDLIRTPEISMQASAVSQLVPVRKFLLGLQRNIAEKNNVIMDGRDIATVVLPGADVKIYLDASAECRAERRYRELVQKGEKVTFDEVLSDVNKRDHQDMTREIAPLKPATDSIIADTTGYNLDESIDMVVKIIKGKINAE